MSIVIQLLEALGQKGQIGALSNADLADAVAGLELDPALRSALLRRDTAELSRLLKGRSNIMLLLVPAEPEVPAEGEDGDEQKDDDAPDQPAIRASAA